MATKPDWAEKKALEIADMYYRDGNFSILEIAEMAIGEGQRRVMRVVERLDKHVAQQDQTNSALGYRKACADILAALKGGK